jgi:Histidine kinase
VPWSGVEGATGVDRRRPTPPTAWFSSANPGFRRKPLAFDRRRTMLAPSRHRSPAMSSLFFVFRIAFAWFLVLFFALLFLSDLIDEHAGPNLFLFLVFAGLFAYVMGGVLSHLRRVKLIAGRADGDTLANRQRRQVEVPFEAGETFDLLDAAIREIPRSEGTESARDSLQVRTKVLRADPYGHEPASRFNPLRWLKARRNLILATVLPGDGTGRITVICEPEGGAWKDLFRVDDGTNYENAEAITRAIARRVADRRRSEQATAQQTSTEKELTVAKLSLLHAQVEPHFLYNTLASAQLLIRSDPPLADQMLGNLIAYLRHSLPRTGDCASTLGEELERARAYLDILRIRMGTRLALQIEVADRLKPQPFPTMMLQTLVENAIKHGLEPKPGGGTVWIIARGDDQSLSVTVADDGQGLNAGSSGTGIGLKNVRERLQLAYGAAASFRLVANFPSGVAATITVPAATMENVRG